MSERESPEFVTGLFRRMLIEAEQGARKRISSWPDGVYRCVTFSDAAGLKRGLIRNCYMTMTKREDRVTVDFTGTSPENLSSYNAHPQAVIGHLANYIYEYVFHDLPISSATFAPFDFIFPEASCLSPTPRAATSNAVMICTGAMSSIANCISRARYPSEGWHQTGAVPRNDSRFHSRSTSRPRSLRGRWPTFEPIRRISPVSVRSRHLAIDNPEVQISRAAIGL